MTPIGEIKSARKRAVSMGRFSGWCVEYNSHPLAACVDNYTAMLDSELSLGYQRCYLFVLSCIEQMAKSINSYCDTHKIDGDVAAQYWLERFLWRCDVVCDFTFMKG